MGEKAPLSGYGALALYPTAFRRLGLSTGNKAPSAAARRSIYAREWNRDRALLLALGDCEDHGDPSSIVHQAPLDVSHGCS